MQENDETERATGLRKKARNETGMGNQTTALKFQTG